MHIFRPRWLEAPICPLRNLVYPRLRQAQPVLHGTIFPPFWSISSSHIDVPSSSCFLIQIFQLHVQRLCFGSPHSQLYLIRFYSRYSGVRWSWIILWWCWIFSYCTGAWSTIPHGMHHLIITGPRDVDASLAISSLFGNGQSHVLVWQIDRNSFRLCLLSVEQLISLEYPSEKKKTKTTYRKFIYKPVSDTKVPIQ